MRTSIRRFEHQGRPVGIADAEADRLRLLCEWGQFLMEIYNFADLRLSPPELTALEKLVDIRRSSKENLSGTLEFPEPGFKLDLESRRSSEARQFKHIHQMCLMHATHFELATKIKAAYILDSYLWAVTQLNPVAIYSAARSLMELRLVTRLVESLLQEARNGGRTDWRQRGQNFFDVIIQSRFGTSDPNVQQLLRTEGCPESALRPFRVSKARALVAKEVPWTDEHYALLCDFVHPNMSSQRTTAAYSGNSKVARSSGGGQMILNKPSPLLRYQFPMPEPGRRAVTQTATRALDTMLGLVDAMNRMPRSPFSEEELAEKTGSAMGLTSAPRTMTVSLSSKTGRNDPCPCGSGKKYKKCHGSMPPN